MAEMAHPDGILTSPSLNSTKITSELTIKVKMNFNSPKLSFCEINYDYFITFSLNLQEMLNINFIFSVFNKVKKTFSFIYMQFNELNW